MVGNLTRDPELRFSPTGTAVASLSVAVNRKRNDVEETSYFDVTAFGTLAEHVAELPKGCRVIVVGRLIQQQWQTKEGDKRSKVAVIADEIGPSVRWATATVTKSGGGKPDDGISRPGKPAYDEEPF